MYGLRMLSIVTALAFLVPFAAAGNVDPEDVPDFPITATADNTVGVQVGPEKVYVVVLGSPSAPSGVELWRETNGCANLQRTFALVCGEWRSADTMLADSTP